MIRRLHRRLYDFLRPYVAAKRRREAELAFLDAGLDQSALPPAEQEELNILWTRWKLHGSV